MLQTRQNRQTLKNITKIEKNSQKSIKIDKNSQKSTKIHKNQNCQFLFNKIDG